MTPPPLGEGIDKTLNKSVKPVIFETQCFRLEALCFSNPGFNRLGNWLIEQKLSQDIFSGCTARRRRKNTVQNIKYYKNNKSKYLVVIY